jgi:hypothetical protein
VSHLADPPDGIEGTTEAIKKQWKTIVDVGGKPVKRLSCGKSDPIAKGKVCERNAYVPPSASRCRRSVNSSSLLYAHSTASFIGDQSVS